MQYLLLVAHGSRRSVSNEEVRHLAVRIAQQAPQRFAGVMSAFLELADPSIPAGIDECTRLGATEILVMPYFLSAGRHVSHDVPHLVRLKQQQYPHIAIRMANYLGASSAMVNWVLQVTDQGGCQQCKTTKCHYPSCMQTR